MKLKVSIDNSYIKDYNISTFVVSHKYTIALLLLSIVVLLNHKIQHSLIAIDILFLVGLVPLAIFNNQSNTFSTTNPIKVYITALISGVFVSSFIIALESILGLGWFSILEITRLYSTTIFSLCFVIISFFSLFTYLYYFRSLLSSSSVNHRIIFYSLSSALILISTYHTITNSLVTSVICASFFLFLDLFMDQKKPNLIWLVLWTIVLGSFLAIIIFYVEQTVLGRGPIPLIDAFSLFSLIFLLCGLVYVPVALVNQKFKVLPATWQFSLAGRSQLRNRIQFSMLFTLIFSFVAIGLVSIYQIQHMETTSASVDFQKSFTQALLNTYVFLFLIGFVIAISLSDYIRTPLIELGNTLKAVKLNKDNKKIQWIGNDEIGDLINEYNGMIEKLQDNASLLAQTERDNAWREMSKQVAHEIKNPLTPMKLSLQHLEFSIQAKRPNIEELTRKMCHTLMAQVENLKQIADEFSNFGSLPKTNNEKVILNDIVETIHDLFRKRGDMEIKLIEPIDDIGAYADKNHLLRVLNNLVKNSIQAIPSDRKGIIELKLWKEENKAIIRVRDNGIGIPSEMQSKIFKPKFTTKSSGSGLGLAIAANMIDSIGGTLYFESTEGKGSDFFVELPLIRSIYSDQLERVIL